MSTPEDVIENLPSMEDFEEGSSLIIEEEDEQSSSSPDPLEGETTEEREAREAREAEEAEQAEKEKAAELHAQEQAEKEEKAKKAEEAKKKASEDEEEEEDEENESSTFYQSVQNIHGIEVDVDYGETDPLTPEGVAMREQAIIAAAIDSQMEYLSKSFPKEYKVLEHALNGGSVDDLFKPGYVDYTKMKLSEDNIEQHKKILKDYYLETGITEKKADLLVEADEDSEGGTFKAAEEVLKTRIKQQEEKEAAILEKQKEEADRLKAQDDKMRQTVINMSTSGTVGNFQVPKADQEKFAEFALSNIRRTGDGTYSFVVPLGSENLDTVMQQAYFSFKKGDLSKLIAIKASTQNAQRLKAKVKSQDKKLKSSESTPRKQDDSKLGTLEDFTVDE
jgi:hypothetical protein